MARWSMRLLSMPVRWCVLRGRILDRGALGGVRMSSLLSVAKWESAVSVWIVV
jgi:hypothetical protein